MASQAKRGNGLNGIAQSISRHPWAAGIPAAERARLVSRARVRAFRAGEAVHLCRDGRHTVWLMDSGLAVGVLRSPSGRPVVEELLRQGDVGGYISCGVGGRECGRETVFLKPSRMVAIPEAEFRAAMVRHPASAEWLVKRLEQRLFQNGQMRALLPERAEKRVLSVLGWLHEELGKELPVTRQLMADAAGVATETAIRVLSPLERKGWIRTHRGRIKILTPQAIAAAGRAEGAR